MDNTIVELGKPGCGWSHIFLKDKEGNEFSGSLSYVDCVVEMFLYSFLRVLEKTGNSFEPICLSFDEEGTEFTLVVTDFLIYCIADRKELFVRRLFINRKTFIDKICNSILENMDAWSEFDVFADTEEELHNEARKNKEIYISLIMRILELNV